MKTIPFIATLIVFALVSCNQKSSDSQPILPDENEAELNNLPEKDPLCDDVKDMADAFPKFDTYRGYQLQETICLANRAYGHKYKAKDGGLQEFTVMLYDTRTDYKDLYDRFMLGCKEAEESKAPNIMRISKLIGDKGFVVAFNDAKSVVGTYDRLIKKTYSLHVLITDDKSAASPDGIEAFIGDFISKINTSKLK